MVVTTPTRNRQLRTRDWASPWDVASMIALSFPASTMSARSDLQLERLGRRGPAGGSGLDVADAGVDRAHHPRPTAGGEQDGERQERGRRLPVGAGDAEDPQLLRGSPEPRVGRIGHRVPRVGARSAAGTSTPGDSRSATTATAPRSAASGMKVQPSWTWPGRAKKTDPGADLVTVGGERGHLAGRDPDHPLRANDVGQGTEAHRPLGHGTSRGARRRRREAAERRRYTSGSIDDLPAPGPGHLVSSEALLEEPDPMPRMVRARHWRAPRPTGRGASRRGYGPRASWPIGPRTRHSASSRPAPRAASRRTGRTTDRPRPPACPRPAAHPRDAPRPGRRGRRRPGTATRPSSAPPAAGGSRPGAASRGPGRAAVRSADRSSGSVTIVCLDALAARRGGRHTAYRRRSRPGAHRRP